MPPDPNNPHHVAMCDAFDELAGHLAAGVDHGHVVDRSLGEVYVHMSINTAEARHWAGQPVKDETVYGLLTPEQRRGGVGRTPRTVVADAPAAKA